MTTLIGLTGLARSGKDTAAKHLNINHDFMTYAFAQPMKEACKIMFGWTNEHVHGDLKEVVDPRYGITPRKALQTLGTEWGRETINNDLWLLRAMVEINVNPKTVITDVRFDNEAAMIKSEGGIIINIVREQREQVRGHKSESGIDSNLVDFTITNNGSIGALNIQLNSLLY